MTELPAAPGLDGLRAAFIARTARSMVEVLLTPGGAIQSVNQGFLELLPPGEDPLGQPLAEFLAPSDGGALAPAPGGLAGVPALFRVLRGRTPGLRVRGHLVATGDGACLLGERALLDSLDALDILTATTVELANRGRDIRRQYRDQAHAYADLEVLHGQTEAEYRLLFENMTQGVIHLDAGGRVLDANPAAQVIFESPLPRIQAVGLASLLARAVREDGSPFPFQEQPWVRVLETRQPQASVVMGLPLDEDGGLRWILVDAVPEGTQGTGSLIFVTFNDISQRMRAEHSLKEREARYRTFFEYGPDGIVLVDAASHQIVEFNDQACGLLGHSREAFSGLALGDLMPAGAAAEATGRLRRIPEGGHDDCELVLRRRDGELRTIHATVQHIRARNQSLLHCVWRDVTERKLAELRLRASEEKFLTAFRAAPVFMVISRLSDRAIQEVNQEFCRATGYRPEEVQGRTMDELGLVGQEDRARILGLLQQRGALRNLEVPFTTRDGRAVPCLLSLEVVPMNGEPHVVAMAIDLTERKAAEADRQRLQKELDHLHRIESLGRLAGGVSHDMNNILGAIMAVASLLQTRHGQDPRLARDAETLLNAATRGRDLVKGLRDFSRKEMEAATLLSLNDLVAQEAELLERTTLKKVAIRLDLQPQLPRVLGEASAISNALMNLCVNACDAMPQGGQLTLATRDLGQGFVELVVADDGEGMPPETLSRALEPFFTTKPHGKGTGLGLSQVYGMMKAHGGTMDLWSAPGQGTRVTLVFPVGARRAGAPEPARVPDAAGTAPLRIFLVDDDELVRLTVPGMLEAMGHRVQTVPGGPEALQALEAGLAADLVILDLSMPGMDGVELLEQVRRRHPDLPVVFATGYVDDRIPEALKRHPRLRILHKPFRREELAEALQGWD